MPVTVIAALAFFATLASSPALADLGADFAAAEAIFVKAVARDGASADQAVRIFEPLATTDSPAAPLLIAYLGAAQTLQGRDAWMPWTKMRATERGLDTLEKALRKLEPRHDSELLRGTPVAVEARLVAASTFIAVPGFFNRYDLGKETLRAALSSPAFARSPASVRASLHHLAAGVAAREKNPHEEAARLKAALAAQPDHRAAVAARQRLQELGS